MKKPKYFKGVSRKKKSSKEPIAVRSIEKPFSLKAESPKNSRVIPERHVKKKGLIFKKPSLKRVRVGKNIWMHLWHAIAIFVLIILGIAMIGELTVLKQKSAQRAVLVAKLNNWEQIAKQYPGYRDAYISLAEISYELGDWNGAQNYLDKALSLDPNNEAALQFENILGQKK